MPINITQIANLASKPAPTSLDPRQSSFLYNMEYIGNGVKNRRGIASWKTNSQWESVRCRGGKTFKLSTDNFYYYFLAFANGEVYYVTSTAFEADNTVAWTRMKNSSGSYPALSSSNTYVTMVEFNNKLFFSDDTKDYFYWAGTGDQLTTGTQPPDKSASTRIGDIDLYRDFLLLADDDGYVYQSNTNNGAAYIAGNYVRFGRIGGLKVSSVTPFNRGCAISLAEPLTKKYKTNYLTGKLLYDPLIQGTEVDSIRVEPLSDSIAIVGRSAQQIGTDLLGLTQLGFTKIRQLDSVGAESSLIAEENSNVISQDIQDWIDKINFSSPENIHSTIDTNNGRYLCAVPGKKSSYANFVFVYDFRKSEPNLPKWSIWKFAINGISSLFSFKGTPFVADLDGNIYETTVDKRFNDNDKAYASEWRSAGLFGDSINLDKDFNEAGISFEIPAQKAVQEIQSYAIIDDVPLTLDTHKMPQTKATLKAREVQSAKFDSSKIYTGSRNWGGGYSNRFHLKMSEKLGTGRTIQLVARSITKDVEWAVTGFYVNDTMTSKSKGDYK